MMPRISARPLPERSERVECLVGKTELKGEVVAQSGITELTPISDRSCDLAFYTLISAFDQFIDVSI